MSSTASDSKAKKAPVKRKKATGKKKVTRKTASKKSKSGTTKVKKKTVAKKKAASTRKAAGKKATTGKKSSVKKPGRKTTRKTAKKAVTKSAVAAATASADAALPPDVTKTTVAAEDSKSLSWMAAQAASALKAVRANQTERAQVLIAKAEITPAAPARPRKAATPGIAADISAENDGSGATTAMQEPAPTAEAAETGEATQPPASALAAQSVAETPRPATRQDTTPASADTLDKTEKPAPTTTKPAEQEKRAAPASEAKPVKTDRLPETTPLPPAPDTHPDSGPASEPARVETAAAQPTKPLSTENAAAAVTAKNEEIVVSQQTVVTTGETTPDEKVAAPAVIETAAAVVQNPEKTAAGVPQPEAIIKPPSKSPATQPAAVIAAASTNTRNRHAARRLLIPGIMVLVAILGIRSWLADDEAPRLATTPVISETQEPAPVTGSKSAAEAIAVVTGKPAKKPAAAGVAADNWSPTTRPGWQESTDYPQRATATTNSGSSARQGQLPQQNPAVTTQANRPATSRPGYYSPGYGYYPQQPLPQQPRYQPAYSRPSYLQ